MNVSVVITIYLMSIAIVMECIVVAMVLTKSVTHLMTMPLMMVVVEPIVVWVMMAIVVSTLV